jgi:hypothetical protein
MRSSWQCVRAQRLLKSLVDLVRSRTREPKLPFCYNLKCDLMSVNLQKKKMKAMFENFDPTKTEISNALNNNYRVYYGPGTKTWVLE